jgi:hypothetical protein
MTTTVDVDDLLGEPKAAVESYQLHFLGPVSVCVRGGVMPDGRVLDYGDVLHVTPTIRELNTDRLGNTWLDKVSDESWQVARWGSVRVVAGPWPDDLPKIKPGSPEWLDAREEARQTAHRLPEAERPAALRAVHEKYGPAPVTSRTTRRIPDRHVS